MLDAEFLSRIEPSKLKDLAAFTNMAWFGYRFMHPGHRVFLYIHWYKQAYKRTAKMLGKRWAMPKWMNSNPLDGARKAEITGFMTGAFTADAHGIPYDLYCNTLMEESLRLSRDAPLQPVEMYHDKMVSKVIDAWTERNTSGIYLARAPQYLAANYQGHPWQDAYYDYLCEHVLDKPNRAFFLAGVMIHNKHLHPDYAAKRLGVELVERAQDYK